MDKKVGFAAESFFNSGFNCAEAVSLAVSKSLLNNKNSDIPKMASFFGGGVGSTHQEMCGAISGAILTIGLLLGRTEHNTNIDEYKKIAGDILENFNDNFSTTNCGKLIEGLDDESKSKKCSNLVRFTAELVYKKLNTYLFSP